MKFQDGFKKKLVQTDFQLNSDNALMTLRKKGGVTLSQSQVRKCHCGTACGGVFAAFAPQPSAHHCCMSAPPSSFVLHLPVVRVGIDGDEHEPKCRRITHLGEHRQRRLKHGHAVAAEGAPRGHDAGKRGHGKRALLRCTAALFGSVGGFGGQSKGQIAEAGGAVACCSVKFMRQG